MSARETFLFKSLTHFYTRRGKNIFKGSLVAKDVTKMWPLGQNL